MKSNFISLNRKILEWRWYNRPNTFRLFVHILLKANYMEKEWERTTIKRGTFVTSSLKLSSELGLSRAKIRTAIRHLTETKEISVSTNKNYMLVTVNKYDSYQFEISSNQQLTNNQPTVNQQLTTTNNINNINNKINVVELDFLFEDQMWLEHLAMSQHLSVRQVKSRMREFIKFLKESGDHEIDIKRARRSFAGFLRNYKPKGKSRHDDIIL